jgi:hypothetical protein
VPFKAGLTVCPTKEKSIRFWISDWLVWFMVFNAPLSTILSYIVAVSFIGGGKPVTKENHQPAPSH